MEDTVGATGSALNILGLTGQRADRAALAKAMSTLVDFLPSLSPVPCPKCRQFHPAMNAILRWLFWQRILFGAMAIAVALAIGAMLLFLKMSANDRLMLATVGALPLCFLVYRYRKDLKLAPVTLSAYQPEAGAPKLRIGIQFNDSPEMNWYSVDPNLLEGGARLPGSHFARRLIWTLVMVIGGLFTFSGLVPCMLFVAVHFFKYRTTDKPPTGPMLLVFLFVLFAGIGMLALGSAKRNRS
ncbi:MAG: hypothetical protein L6R28_05010 [Planctomycetes bacterium]|nr:hypothetical protein [Planctomycetota bacterium]